jgi:hypothetical protein
LFRENLSGAVLAFYCESLNFFESLRFLLFHFLLLSFDFALCSGEEALLLFGKFFGVLFDFCFVSHSLVILKYQIYYGRKNLHHVLQ